MQSDQQVERIWEKKFTKKKFKFNKQNRSILRKFSEVKREVRLIKEREGEKKEYQGRVLIRSRETSFKELGSGVHHHRLHWWEKNEEREIETLDSKLRAKP